MSTITWWSQPGILSPGLIGNTLIVIVFPGGPLDQTFLEKYSVITCGLAFSSTGILSHHMHCSLGWKSRNHRWERVQTVLASGIFSRGKETWNAESLSGTTTVTPGILPLSNSSYSYHLVRKYRKKNPLSSDSPPNVHPSWGRDRPELERLQHELLSVALLISR